MTTFAPRPPKPHASAVPHWLVHLGPLGLVAVAVIDSSVVPLPIPGTTDLFLLWLVAHHGNPWLLVACAVGGSLVGGYATWLMGHKGGEAALQRYVPKRILKRIVGWVQRHPAPSVFLPAVLPPPIPLSPFILASGALGVPCGRFLLIFGLARALRYSAIAWLAAVYGPRVIRLWSGTLQKWSAPLLWAFAALMLCGIVLAIRKLRRLRTSGAAKAHA
jgi:membrane protein YqaA with SNARE-associated domain